MQLVLTDCAGNGPRIDFFFLPFEYIRIILYLFICAVYLSPNSSEWKYSFLYFLRPHCAPFALPSLHWPSSWTSPYIFYHPWPRVTGVTSLSYFWPSWMYTQYPLPFPYFHSYFSYYPKFSVGEFWSHYCPINTMTPQYLQVKVPLAFSLC